MENLTKEEIDFIGSALNAYWNQAVQELTEKGHRRELGELEKIMLEKQRDMAKNLMQKIGML
jgi:hypothetical protein